MPRVILADGTSVYIPGVYTTSEVVNDLPGPLPEFHIPIIVADADEGTPYNAQDTKFVNEADFSPFKLIKTAGAAEREFGGKGVEAAKAMRFAKRHGLPFAYMVVINALTRATVIATSTGPVNEMTLFSKKHGAVGGHHKITVAAPSNTITVTPVQRSTLLTADAALGDTRIFVKDNSWFTPGLSVEIGDNTVANAAVEVADIGEEFDANGQISKFVDLTAGLAAGVTTADFAMFVQYNTSSPEVSPALTTGQQVFDWFNDTSKYIGAKKEGTFSDALLIVSAISPLKEIATWSTVTAGTSPAATVTQHDDFIADLDAVEWDNFLVNEGLVPQAFLIVDGSSTIHASWRDWAIAKRAEGFPVSITSGTDWGDTSTTAGNDTDPTFRAGVLNSQDFMLCAGGLDFEAAYLSYAPAVFGRRIEGGINHNLTNDELLYESLEKIWDERTLGQVTTLLRAGVVIQRLLVAGTPRFVVAEGLSTLQNNVEAWNTVTNDTPLVHQRDLADFFDRVAIEDLDGKQVGADEVTPDTIAAVLITRVELSLEKRGYIVRGSYRINSIVKNSAGAGFDVDHTVEFPTTSDFITVNTQIRVGA